MYAKHLNELKYDYLINEHEKVNIKHHKYRKAFIQCLEEINELFKGYKSIEEYNSTRKRTVFIVHNDIISDMLNKKKP